MQHETCTLIETFPRTANGRSFYVRRCEELVYTRLTAEGEAASPAG